MPPKVKFTKEEIVQAALEVARVKGAAEVTTRDIAAQLGVSTRPIFTWFRSMDEVRAEIRRAAEERYRGYVAEGLRQPVPFLGYGMQYIRFAREEPELYRLLFMTAGPDGSNVTSEYVSCRAMIQDTLQRIYRMSPQTAEACFRNLWLVVHGLATLIVTGDCPYDDNQIRGLLTQCSLSFCLASKEIPGFAAGTFDRDRIFSELVQRPEAEA